MLVRYNCGVKNFVKKNALFWFPVLVILFFLETFAIISGELFPIEKVVKHQSENEKHVLFGRKIVDQDLRRYKYMMILEKKPKILVLGSSRILQIRKEMFDSSNDFYNAGGILHNSGDLLDFIKTLPENVNPEIIFLGIDFYWFSDKREITNGISESMQIMDAVYQWKSHLYTCRYLFFEIFKNPKILEEIINREDGFNKNCSIGLQALTGNGFRSDGSYQYGTYIQEMRKECKYIDRESPPIIERVRNGISQFKHNSKFDEVRFEKLRQFLQICKARKIEVVGIAPPLSSEVYTEITTSLHHKDLFKKFRIHTQKLFEETEFLFFDFSDLSKIGLNDLYMFDGLHSSETAMAKILTIIFKTDRLNTKINNLNKILNLLEQKLNSEQARPFEINW